MIFFIDLPVILLIVGVFLTMLFQVLIPLKQETPLFPFFRKTDTKEALEKAEDEIDRRLKGEY